MIRTLLYRLTNRLPARTISDDGTPYLERYYVGTLFGVRFYLHQFVDSDPDRGLHDHPWPWAFSFILAGSYLEETRSGTRRVRWFNTLVGDSFHRVILPDPAKPVWTLFGHRAKRVKPWGFMRVSKAPDVFVFVQHTPSTDEHWWRTAPSGRHLRGLA